MKRWHRLFTTAEIARIIRSLRRFGLPAFDQHPHLFGHDKGAQSVQIAFDGN
jgi:hypothetical protein